MNTHPSGAVEVNGVRMSPPASGRARDGDVEVHHHSITHDGGGVVETWVSVHNHGAQPVSIGRTDSVVLDLPDGSLELLRFTSAWGTEFSPHTEPISGPVVVGTTAGRSSQGAHPLIALRFLGGDHLVASVMWSGNWVLRLDPLAGGGFRLSGGLHDQGFAKALAPGETFDSPRVVIAAGDIDAISLRLAAVGRTHWYPRNTRAASLPIEWNHWWSYEDAEIDEETFRRNADVARRIGVEVCTLDAGWFGPSDPGTHWGDYRGDWHLVNSTRFPSGLRALSDYVHNAGMLFGIWCEIEAVGSRAALADQHPSFLATRDDDRLGYVCFGNPEVRAWALDTLKRMIVEHGADWIKLDFNLDPGLGCDRTDHGHGAGDGLYEHYRGYYATLDQLRSANPDVVLDNCSSGGLRLDLEMLRHTDLTFLSDPDWPEHGLQVMWAASLMFAPDRLLHWGFSEWRGKQAQQTLDLRDPELSRSAFDYYRRIAMLGATGCAFRLPDLPGWIEDRLTEHHRFYREVVRRFVQQGSVHRLTKQPLRGGDGDRWAGFQYSLPDEHLVFTFRLDGGDHSRTLRLKGLDRERSYDVRWIDSAHRERRTGAELMSNGVTVDSLPEQGSEVLLLEAVA